MFWFGRKKRCAYNNLKSKIPPKVSENNDPDTSGNKKIEYTEKDTINYTYNAIESCQSVFSSHMADYAGQIVTIFVKSGGLSGLGFTGILLNVCKEYITLIIRKGPVPSFSLGNACSTCYKFVPCSIPFNHAQTVTAKGVLNTGSIAYIPIDKIASFIHNTI